MRVNKPRNLRSTAKYFTLSILAICLLCISHSTVKAATFTVTNTDDSGPGSLRQAIIDANTTAGADVIVFDTAGVFATPQSITLGGTELFISDHLTINGTGAGKLTISGNNASRVFAVEVGIVTLDGMSISRGTGVGASLSGRGGAILNRFGSLTITNCTVSGSSAGWGGGIYVGVGTLNLMNSTVSGNSTSGSSGGGIYFNAGTGNVTNSTVKANAAHGTGGGIYVNGGTFTLTNSTVSDNSADQGGGGIHAGNSITVTNSTITGNRATSSFMPPGGGILSSFGTVNLTSTIVAGNFNSAGPTANDISLNSNAITNADHCLIGNAGSAGGIQNGVNGNIVGVDAKLGPLADNGGPTQTHALLFGSPAVDKGTNSGAVSNDQRGAGFARTINDPNVDNATDGTDIGAVESNFLVVNTTAQDDDGACQLLSEGDCTLREAIIKANSDVGTETIAFDIPTTDSGYDSVADRYTITLTSVLPNLDSDLFIDGLGAKRLTVKRDSAAAHFRILNVSYGRKITISGLTISGGREKFGGGISNGGTLVISNSTVSGNLSHLEIIPDCCSYGGGISNGGTLIISNSTVSGNSADGGGGGISNFGTLTISNGTLSGNTGGEGGAISNYKTLTVSNSTVTGNTSAIGGGIYSDATLHLNTSIVANNTAGNAGPDILGTVSSGDYNLIENTQGMILPADSTHNITGIDPKLGPLADNGGPTMTHALLCGSSAIDQGKKFDASGTDQRGAGFARTFDDPAMANAADGDGTDIGALELQAPLVCNTAPVANGDSYSTDEDTPLLGSSVLANDSDGENDTLTAVLVSGPSNAQAFTLNPDGSFSYTANTDFNGSDSFTYKANDGSLDSNTATVTITVNAVNDGPVVSATPATQSVQYSDPISAVAITVTDVDSALGPQSVSTTFNVDGGAFSDGLPSGLSFGLAVCSGKVGSECKGGLSGNANVAAGTYVIRVNVSDGVLSSSTDVTLVVNKEKTETAYTGDVFMFTAGPTVTTANVRLSAQLTQQADGNAGDITLAKVSFLLFKSSNLGSTPDVIVAGVAVDQSGAALKFANLGVDTWTIKVKIDADNAYWKASPVGMGTVTVEQPTNELRTSGGGWVNDPESMNGKGNFGFNVANQKKGIRGGSVYLFRGLDGFNYLVKNTSWQSGGIGFSSEGAIISKAAFSGKCVVQKIDPETGEVVDSYGNYSFTVDVRDGDLFNPRQADKYALTVLNSNGLVWRQIGSRANPPAIGGGNITVKAK